MAGDPTTEARMLFYSKGGKQAARLHKVTATLNPKAHGWGSPFCSDFMV